MAKSCTRKLTTREAALVVSSEMGLDPGLSEREVTSLVRSWPISCAPPVEGGKRRWGREHLMRLRSHVEQARAPRAGLVTE